MSNNTTARKTSFGNWWKPGSATSQVIRDHLLLNYASVGCLVLMGIVLLFFATAVRNLLPMQKGDVPQTYAAPDLLRELTGYVPETNVPTGVRNFVEWHRKYYVV